VLTVPNALTLTRAGAAAMACGTAFSGRGRRAALVALLLGCTVCDWLDGPLARRLGPTRLGAVLDLEADSWLTLWGAAAAFRMGGVPAVCLLPPALRYPLSAGSRPGTRPWQRAAGVAQMAVVAAGLTARWPAPRALAVAAAGLQLAALGADVLRRPSGPPAREPARGTGAGSATLDPTRRTVPWRGGRGSRPATPAATPPAAPTPG